MHHVDPERSFPGFSGVADRKRTNVTNECVDATESCGCSLDPLLQLFGVTDVDRLPEALDALGGERFRRRCYLICITRTDRDVGAFGGEKLGDSQTDPLTSAGDQRILPAEFQIHRPKSLLEIIARAYKQQRSALSNKAK